MKLLKLWPSWGPKWVPTHPSLLGPVEGYPLTAETRCNPATNRLVWLASILQNSKYDAADILGVLGMSSLKSIDTLSTGIQLRLPLDQWQIDMMHVWATTQAYLQSLFVDVARGPSDLSLEDYKLSPSTSAERQMCNNQVSNPPWGVVPI